MSRSPPPPHILGGWAQVGTKTSKNYLEMSKAIVFKIDSYHYLNQIEKDKRPITLPKNVISVKTAPAWSGSTRWMTLSWELTDMVNGNLS